MVTSTTFWVAVAFFVFIGLVAWKAGRSILLALDERSDAIRRALDEAAEIQEEAQRTLAEYKRKQRDTLEEAHEIIEHARAEAVRLRREAEEALEESLRRREQQARDRIARAEAAAVQEFREAAVEVAVAATRSLLEASITKTKGKALIDETISTLSTDFH